MHLFPKPLQQIVIDADCDPRLPCRRLQDRPTFSTRKVVLCFHGLTSYSSRSCAVALRADMRRPFAAPGVDDNEHISECVGADCDVAFLILFIVSNGDRLLIVQDGGCVGKVYAVLLEVRRCFPQVPFALVRHRSKCMHNCAYCQSAALYASWAAARRSTW